MLQFAIQHCKLVGARRVLYKKDFYFARTLVFLFVPSVLKCCVWLEFIISSDFGIRFVEVLASTESGLVL